jgi:hypothetical protein
MRIIISHFRLTLLRALSAGRDSSLETLVQSVASGTDVLDTYIGIDGQIYKNLFNKQTARQVFYNFYTCTECQQSMYPK